MDWLSKRKFVIVCHEKVVRIPLEGDEILRVHGERTQGVVKTLVNTKTRVSYDLVIFREEHQCRLLRREAWSSFEVSVGITEEGEVLNVKDKILATPRETSKVENAPAEMLKERVQPRRVRAMAMTIQYGVRGMILVAQSEAFKQENAFAERLHGLDQQMERKEDENNSKEWNSGDDQLRLRWMIYLVVLADAAESVRDTIGFEYCLASSSGWTKSPVLWAEIGESSLTGPELVLDTTDKVVLIKEKLKAARDRQKSYADKRRKPLEFEVGDRVLLKVSPWKGVVHFGKKGKLALRYVRPFEILERIGLVAYRLRLPEELNCVHDTFHVSNLKNCLGNANLLVPLNEIKIDKTLRFVEEPIEIMDREIKSLKRSRIPLVKVCWNSKRGPEFTWEREDYMKFKYPQLFVDRVNESAS
ncbi:hypothetical protein Tco_1184058 [Tanacetum coccineum]